MDHKVFTREEWQQISDLISLLNTMQRIEKENAQTHAQRNAVNHVRRMLFEDLDRRLASGEWRTLPLDDRGGDLPF